MIHLIIPARLHGRSKPNTPKDSSPPSRAVSPKPMNDSTLILKVTVIKGRNLAPKDRNGFSDPFVVLSLSDYRFTTEAIYKTLDPTWNATFDMPLSGVGSLTLECVCWDKDRFGKDYMGEFSLSLDEIFNGKVQQEPQWYPLKSTRKNSKISGEIQVQLSLVDGSNPALPADQLYTKWTQFLSAVNGSPSLDDGEISARGLNELGARATTGENDDTSDEGDELRSDDSTLAGKESKKDKLIKATKLDKLRPVELLQGSDVVGVIFLEISHITDLPPEHNMMRTGFDMDPFVVASLGKKTYRTKHIRHCLNPVYDEKMVFQVLRHEQNYQLHFVVIDRDKLSGNDYVADASLSLQEIIATQPSKNPVTGLYTLAEPLKPETSNGNGNSTKPRFRLPIPRTSSSTSLASKKNRPELAHSSSSSSLHSSGGNNGLEVRVDTALDAPPPQPSPTKIIPAMNDSTDPDMKPFTLSLILKNKERWEDKHKPELFIKAKYIPYPALRQQFWRCMLRQYDTDDSLLISRIELTTMLDSLGSTLTSKTIDGFFRRFMEENGADSLDATELTMDQAVWCLEDKLNSISQKQSSLRAKLPHISVPSLGGASGDERSGSTTPMEMPSATNSSSSLSLNKQVQPVPPLGPAGEDGTLMSINDELGDSEDKSGEHVIQIKECPLCHQPRLNKRNDVDIITHLATCASADWRQVDRLVMGGFVTSSQAQRKWYSKIINKVSYGGYKVGANSANILVQDRITGQIQEERMSVYVRLGIRLLYKGLKSSNMENKRIRKLLQSLSVKQGKKFDNPLSVREIKQFIEFHQLDLSEVLLPLDQFKSFNEFFYRALKPTARPCSAPDNPKIIVSPADCRSVVFNRIDDATSIWIKGREFSIKRLLGSAYPEDAKLYDNGGLGIFRLAPQDYHRFHCPVDGIMGEPKLIKGEYYTVNPMAIRSALDVYGENIRTCVPVESPIFGRVMVICVGAMMVGSTVITAKEGQKISRTDELGYFKFGGSTLVVLFEPGRMLWDDDLISNSSEALETLIRVGMSVGHSPDTEPPSERKVNVTKEDLQDAQRRIEGSLAPKAS